MTLGSCHHPAVSESHRILKKLLGHVEGEAGISAEYAP